MFIYKITNTVNNKCYIGQTINLPDERWKRHINDAKSGRLNTHLARALRKYPIKNFTLEIIDTAETQDELNQKEQNWIIYYNSIENGYNETAAISKCGGNTYKSKTEEELKIIGEKIRQSKIGGNNPHSTKVKCKNIETLEELHFDSQAEMQEFFHASNHQFISRRCRGEIKSLYQKHWAIAYEDDDYDSSCTPHKQNVRAKTIIVKNLKNNEEKEFPSYAEAERHFSLPKKSLSSKAYKRGNNFLYKEQYLVTKNFK